MNTAVRHTIAYADHAVETGGAEVSLSLLLHHLDRSRYRPILFHAPAAEWLDGPFDLGDTQLIEAFDDPALLGTRREQIGRGLLANFGKIARALWTVRRVRGLLVRVSADLVHTNTLKCHLLAGAAARMAGLPVVWHMRDIVSERGARAMLRQAARIIRPTIIAVSRAVAQSVADFGAPVEVIHNGLLLDDFAPGEPDPALLDELGLAPTDRVLMITARITPWKGHRELIRALPAVLERFPDARLVVVGDVKFWAESYLDELKSLADELGVAGAIRWAGHRHDVPALLRLCEVFVLPSRDEPFGRAIVEAMAVGKPVVAGKTGAVPEICPHGECGLLVDPEDPSEIAAALIELLSNPARAREMGERGHQRAHTLFDAAATAQKVQALYERILSSRP